MPYTKTIEQKVYTFEDVKTNEEFRDKVIKRWRESTIRDSDYHWIDETRESFKKFNDSLPYPPENEDITGLRLRTWIINNYLPTIQKPKQYWATRNEDGSLRPNSVGKDSIRRNSNLQVMICCPFTGYAADHEALQPIMEFIKKPCNTTTWSDLIEECNDRLQPTIDREVEHQLSDEYILDTIEANEYEFDENGNII